MWQREYPTAALADKFVDEYIDENMKTTDANDFVYQYDASRNYDPSKELWKISAPLMLINFQEDFWNPAELGVAEQEIKRVRNGELVVLPFSPQSRGHYTFFQAGLWEQYLARFLAKLKP